jgi:DNA-binding winged helix-turn-helix (wHTH) protein/Tol biopolymer transport system component
MTQLETTLVYDFGGFRLDPRRRLLSGADGELISLKPKVFDTLLYFVEHAGELLDKRVLMQALWGDVIVEENSLNQLISTLRRVLGENPGENRFIVTVPGRGYRFVANVSRSQTSEAYEPAIKVAEAALAALTAESTPAVAPNERSRSVGAVALAALVALVGVVAWSIANRSAPEISADVIRLSIPALEGPAREPLGSRHIAISDDGSRVAYSAGGRLWIRRLREEAPDTFEMRTDNPFFSPNGEWLGFFSNGLMKVPTGGGRPTLLAATTERPAGATWGRNGTIVFATTEGLYRVAENGGEPELLTRPDPLRKERLYAWPEFMPDGQSVLFTVIPEASTDAAQIAVLNLRTRESKIVLTDGTAARYAASGHLLYVSGQSLNAIAFDPNALETRGEAIVVPNTAIATAADSGAAEFAVSATGTLLFVAPSAARAETLRTMSWIDRQGVEEPLALALGPGRYNYPRISPDGTRVALDMFSDNNRDIWIWNLGRQSLTRLTTGSTEDMMPLWTPDSRSVFFASNRAGTFDIYSQPADGAAEARVEFAGAGFQTPMSFTPDGARLVVYENFRDLGVLNLAQSDRLEPLLHGEFDERLGEVSPDGHWIAYESDESGNQSEIFLRPFPNVGARREKISIDGGRYPRWGRQGSDELFYVGLDGGVMAAAVRLSPSLELGRVTKLFDWVRPPTVGGRPYDVSPVDGRFLVITNATGANESTTISVVLNWFEELRGLVPVK